MDLPRVIPLFPLPNAVLFPGVPLPLHIFEPRYREMVRDTARREDRVIGMVLLRGDWRKEYHGNPEVFSLGCAGRMVNVEALADGRYNILLHGLREFVIDSELRRHQYREATVTWRPAASGGLAPRLRARIQELMRHFLGSSESGLGRKLLDDPSVSDELLVNYLCYALEFSPLEKQALLEAPSLSDRGARLCDVLHFALEASGGRCEGEEWCH